MSTDQHLSELSTALKQSNLPSLDGLRTIAVFLVVFFHFGLPYVNGGLGVLMFFVISGFLITWLLLKEEEKWGSISLKLFYIRRALRIFPAFYAYWLLVVVGFALIGKRVDWTQAATSALYLNNYYQAIFGDPNTGLSHTWSLAIEEQFYVLWPAAFIALRKTERRIRVLSAVIVALWLYRTFMVLAVGIKQGYVYEAFDMRADHLAVGCLLATMLYRQTAPWLWRTICARPWSIWITFGLLATSSVAPHLVTWRYRDIVGFVVDPVLSAVLIVQGLTFYATSASWLNRVWVRWLGRMSSIYLYQQIALSPAKKFLTGSPLIVQLIVAVGFCVAVSAVSYYVIETPFLKLKDRIGKRKKSESNAPAISASHP